MNKDYIKNEYLLCVNVEDTTYMLWQLELFIWSITNNYSVNGDEFGLVDPKDILVVIILNGDSLSNYAKNIINHYGIRYVVDHQNFGSRGRLIRFKGNNGFGTDVYKPLNKPCSMGVIWRYIENNEEDMIGYKFIVIMEADLYAYGGIDFDKFPKDKTSIAQHWIIDNWTDNKKMGTDENTGSTDEPGERNLFNKVQYNAGLTDLLKIAGVSSENIKKFVPGACIIWIKKEDFTTKLVDKTILWNQFMESLTALKTDEILYISELPIYSLALSQCGIDVEQICNEKFPEFNPGNMDKQVYGKEIPIRSLIHYTYPHLWPLKNGPKHGDGDHFNKRCYGQKSCLETDNDGNVIVPNNHLLNPIFNYVRDLEEGKKSAETGHQTSFFDYCLEIGKSVNIDRTGSYAGQDFGTIKQIMVIPHPDDELVFLSQYLESVSEIICVVKPNDEARIDSFINWEDRKPFKRSFVGLPDYVPNGNIEFIPNFDEELDKVLKDFQGNIIIPGFNYQYGHPHHIQLQEYMEKRFSFKGAVKANLNKEKCRLKELNFKKCYPTWVHMLNDTISESLPGDDSNGVKLWKDFFMSGVEEALVFEKD